MNGDVARRARWGRWAASALAASLGVAVPFVRLAEGHAPTVWERAQDPSLAKGDQIHREVQGLRYSAFFFRFNSAARQEQLVRAVRMLDEVDAEHASDVRLRFDLGSLLALVDQDKRAAAVLENAIAASPEHRQARKHEHHQAARQALTLGRLRPRRDHAVEGSTAAVAIGTTGSE